MDWASLGIDPIEGIDGDHRFDFDPKLRARIRTVLRAHGQADAKAFADLVNVRLVRCGGRWKALKLESAASGRKESLRALSAFLSDLNRSVRELGNIDQNPLAKRGIFTLMNNDPSNALRNVISALQDEDLIVFLKGAGSSQIDQIVGSAKSGAPSIIEIGKPLGRLLAHVGGRLNQVNMLTGHEGARLTPTAACRLTAELLDIVDVPVPAKTLLNNRAILSRVAGKV